MRDGRDAGRLQLVAAHGWDVAGAQRAGMRSAFVALGSRGDGYENALAKTINRVYKAKLIHRRGLWKTKEALELATLQWASCLNHHRLLAPIGYIAPAEAEANYYRQLVEKTEPPGFLLTKQPS